MAFLTWIGLKYVPGGHSLFIGHINSFVHTVMYFYYFLMSYQKFKKNLWWKKYLTQLQLVSFFGLDFIEFGFHRKYFLDSIWTHLTSLDVFDFSTMDRA